MRAAPRQAMPATALLNMGGNFGGVVATPTIAALSQAHRWNDVFALEAVLAVCAALAARVNVAAARAPEEAT